MKQRLIGITVLIVLILAIVFLLLYGARQGDRFGAPEEKNLGSGKTEVQLAVPTEGPAAAANVSSNTAATEQSTAAVPTPTAATASSAAVSSNQVVVTSPNSTEATPAPANVAPVTTSAAPNAEANKEVVISDKFGQVAASGAKPSGKAPAQSKTMPTNVPPVAAPAQPAAAANNQEEPTSAPNAVTDSADQEQAAAASAPQEETTPAAVKKDKKLKTKVKAMVKKPGLKTAKIKKITKAPMPVTVQTHKGWALKIGSFASPLHATDLIKQLKAHGYRSYSNLLVTNHGVLTQVFVGPVATRAEALKLAKSVDVAFKVKGTIVPAK